MNIKIFFYLFSLFLFFPAICAQVYTIGVENIDYYPFYSINAKGEYIGFARDVFDLFAAQNKMSFVYEVRSVKKLDQEFINERRFDFKFPDNKLWKIVNKKGSEVFYSMPVCNFIDGVIVREENKDKNIQFFEKLGIGVVRGYTILGFENSRVPISESPDIQTLIEKLKYNLISGAYFNVEVALNKLMDIKTKKNSFVFNQKIPYYKSSFYLSTFNYPEIIIDFNQFMNENRDKISTLKRKYGIKD